MYSNEHFDVDAKGNIFDKHGNPWGHVKFLYGWIWSDGKDTEWYTGPELIQIGGLLEELDLHVKPMALR